MSSAQAHLTFWAIFSTRDLVAALRKHILELCCVREHLHKVSTVQVLQRHNPNVGQRFMEDKDCMLTFLKVLWL